MSSRSENVYRWPTNRNIQLMWSFRRLIFNLLIWNIMVRLIIFLNVLVDPNFAENGAKIFQILSDDRLLQTGIISFVAFFSWMAEDIFFYKFLARKSMAGLFGFRILFLTAMLIFTYWVVAIIHYKPILTTDLAEYFSLMKNFFINRASAYLFITAILIATLINFFKAIQQKIGFEKFWPYITGQFRTPREENRIFLFIDLISSTKFAEQLGHKKYSLFLQECFKHLGMLELKYKAMQYQIVGDEVVLSWPAKKQNYLFAVLFYYEYISLLKNKTDYFQEKFGVIPKFTASINSGNVMVSEVGTVKSEIAFHGDVLNTAARIQQQCKSYKKQLLVTQNFAIEYKKHNPDQKVSWVGQTILRGKKNPVKIYTIELKGFKRREVAI